MKNLLLTFDYELFLGQKSGSVQKCLIEPTERLRGLLQRFEMKAVFFVDTVYLVQLEKKALEHNQAQKDIGIINDQLKQLAGEGHFIFPHIHPHWLDALYKPSQNEWDLSNISKYRFHSLSPSQRSAVFLESVGYLDSLFATMNTGFLPRGYRAGGWCLQPFEDFKPFFDLYNIKYEFSVLKGVACSSTTRYFDFSSLADVNDIFRFSNDVTKPDPEGKYTEFCISVLPPLSFPEIFMSKVLFKLLPTRFKKNYGDGLSVRAEEYTSSEKPVLPESKRSMASIELMDVFSINHYTAHLKKQDYLQIISHPKMISLYNLKVFERFLLRVHKKYEVETDFRKMC